MHEIAQRTANEVRDLITNNGVRFFGVGGAWGYDTLAADVLFQLREKEFPYIKIILVYPFNGFTNRWSAEQKAVYDRFLPKYNKLVCVSDTPCKAHIWQEIATLLTIPPFASTTARAAAAGQPTPFDTPSGAA